MSCYKLGASSIQMQTAKEGGVKGKDEIALFASNESRPTEIVFRALATEPICDHLLRLLHGTTLAPNPSADENLVFTGRIQSLYAQFP